MLLCLQHIILAKVLHDIVPLWCSNVMKRKLHDCDTSEMLIYTA